MAKISIQNLNKQYKGGEIQAVRDLSFEVKDGEFFCLLGPAGAGKTTTIKLISGIEPADKGEVFIGDQNVTDALPMDRDVAVAFETYALYPQRTVSENLRFPLEAPIRKSEMSTQEMDNRVREIADLLGIGELLDRYPRQLSGGQRQRVALGRALIRKPKTYLLDEPIAHLDAKLRHRMRGELKRIQRELGITTIYTTPDQLEALSMADTMAVINNGQLEQLGTPDEIYKRPRNIFVARFVGEPPMNILEGIYEDQKVIVKNHFQLPVPKETQKILSGLTNGKDVILGIRAKDIQVMPPDSSKHLAQAAVKYVQIMGETSIVTIALDSLDLHVKMATQEAPQRGEKIGFAFQVADCHFFDPITQLRMS